MVSRENQSEAADQAIIDSEKKEAWTWRRREDEQIQTSGVLFMGEL